ncbi:MAG: electron transfer flavoprotein subunit beta/FixA family protein [Deltaproteobacteria bacterium]|nr:electron transfer flavoprotein subunit beta/FixA family protein [Deltaproteobacteria bacterium]
MKIAACVKITPATDSRISILADGTGIDASGIKWIISPYDQVAIEQAVLLAEANKGTEVVIVTVGDDNAVAQLRAGALAVGGDRAVLVQDAALANSDNLGVAKALAAVLKKEAVDLAFFGKVAVDDDASQVPGMAAELLGWPQVSSASKFELAGSGFTAVRAVGGGMEQEVRGSFPVVITADRDLAVPRYAKLPQIMKAKKKKVDTLSLSDLGLSAGDVAPKVAVSSYALPPSREKVTLLGGSAQEAAAELVRRLRDEAKVL